MYLCIFDPDLPTLTIMPSSSMLLHKMLDAYLVISVHSNPWRAAVLKNKIDGPINNALVIKKYLGLQASSNGLLISDSNLTMFLLKYQGLTSLDIA